MNSISDWPYNQRLFYFPKANLFLGHPVSICTHSRKDMGSIKGHSLTKGIKKALVCLSSLIWKIKERNLPYRLTFSVMTLAPAYTKESKFCFLCLAEKTSILFSNHFSSLNKRSELMGKCRHRQKQLLLNW